MPLSAMAQSLWIKGAEDGAGWVTSRTDGVLFLLVHFAVLNKESDICCFVSGVGWELLSYIQIFLQELCLAVSRYSFMLMSKRPGLLLWCRINMCCTHQGDIPCGAWGGIAEAGGFFPHFPFPRGACYFWCLVYPRQNKINLFEVIAVLFSGSRSWCDVGTWLWGLFPNPVLVAKQLPNVAFWSADVAETFQCR